MSTEQLEIAASTLGELRERVVFLGGATIGLWITDPAARAPRVTYDVDYGVEGALASADARERARAVTIPRLSHLAT